MQVSFLVNFKMYWFLVENCIAWLLFSIKSIVKIKRIITKKCYCEAVSAGAIFSIREKDVDLKAYC